jgi:murein L,D-transpeptidase YcbB/YkuD
MTNKILFIFFFVSLCLVNKYPAAQTNSLHLNTTKNFISPVLIHTSLVNKFYLLTGNKLKWFIATDQSQLLRNELKNRIDNSANMGFQKNKYHVVELDKNVDKEFQLQDSAAAMQMDRLFTDAAFAYCKDVYQGVNISRWMKYDEISKKYEGADNSFLLNMLSTVTSVNDLIIFFNSLEPKDKEYMALRNKLQYRADTLTALQKKQLITSLNFYRWVHHFNFEKYIVVNIPSALLKYYEYDSLKLQMKLVVGKPSTKTPRFAAYCSQVILYPYWNVPTSIALKELLPKIKRNPKYIDQLNMQLINSGGQVVDHYKLNWSNYSRSFFPFRLRQSTGCDNSLGVIKFDLTSPFSVYLHDTNNKNAFLSSTRFLSHGCIRLEKPLDLANNVLFNKVDSKYLEACLKDQVPIPKNLARPVPVFVIYQTAEMDVKNEIRFYKDIYGLLK